MADEKRPLANPKPEESTGQQGSGGDLKARVEQLEAALANARAGMPLNLTPLHGAGEGEEVAESWGQYDQEQARLEA